MPVIISMPRQVWLVLWSKEHGQWTVRGPINTSLHGTKAKAVDVGRAAARAHHRAGGLSQLVLRTKDGRIQIEFTYGRDPRRTKG